MDTKKTTVGRLYKDVSGINISRSGPWGNPFKIGRDGDRAEVLDKFRRWFYSISGYQYRQSVEQLRGKRLLCYCKPLDCHGDVIAEYLNASE